MAKQLTMAQAAASLEVSIRRVRQLIEDGRLASRRLGRIHMIDERALDAVRLRRRTGRPKKAVA